MASNLPIVEHIPEIINHEDIIKEPEEGMVFDTFEEAFVYYAKYATTRGFTVAKKSSRKVQGVVSYATFECNRGGKGSLKRSNPNKPPTKTKIECPAHINLALKPDLRWRISSVKLEHNHECSLEDSKFFKSNRLLLGEQVKVKKQCVVNDKEGEIVVYKSGELGHKSVPFNLNLEFKKDTDAMRNYLIKMHKENSGFFWTMEVDENNQLKSVFWADARSRAACREFGDVISFDTTYLTNKYLMLFATFVGVNHHGQSILLGSGLISQEDVSSFSWLFRTWKLCMWEYFPPAIITDQCMAVKNAIEEVFPGTRHRWCIWHIMNKVPEKLGKLGNFQSIESCLSNIVYDSVFKEEFEMRWSVFVSEYDLEENEWLNGLYKERARWVPAFLKDTFWAGMSFEKGESLSTYFGDYINEKTTLKQFVERYESALARKVESEKEEDIKSLQSFIPMLVNHGLEKQFHTVYTNTKVKEFQEQFVAKLKCTLHVKKEGGLISEYEVVESIRYGEENKEKRTSFSVNFNNETHEADCNCRLFEFRGMVCAHQLMVWSHLEVLRAPEKYVLRRWRKDVQRIHSMIPVSHDRVLDKSEVLRQEQFGRVCSRIGGLIQGSEEKFDRAMKVLQGLEREFEQSAGTPKWYLV